MERRRPARPRFRRSDSAGCGDDTCPDWASKGDGGMIEDRRDMPFANNIERAIHFQKHGPKLGIATEEEYERLADSFLFGPLAPPTSECTRPNQIDCLRFNDWSSRFGVACIRPVFVRTLYRVDRAKIARHGEAPGFFRYECGRTNL